MKEITVQTPLGAITVENKGDLNDYPGIWIDLTKTDGTKISLAMVEYELIKKSIQTAVYGEATNEEPTNIIVHKIDA